MRLEQYFEAVDDAYSLPTPAETERQIRVLANEAAAEYGEESAECAALRSELGGFYRGQGRYAESAAELSAALAILERAVGKTSPDYATALNNLAGTHRLLREFGLAAAEFSEALELCGAALGKEHVLYAAGLNNLSLLCLDRNDLDGAENYLRRSSAILEKLPECRDELASSLCNLAALSFKRGKPEEGIPRLEQAITLFETELGTDTPHYHAAWTSLGLCRRALGDFTGAISAFTKAADAAASLYGEQHRDYCRILQYLEDVKTAMEEAQ